ncbi:hypothetical protein sphantq_04709 (plasmid) [Sphingobium sp. AntQ-1]|uniref:hypothetical protein n=1 Tax=Sphingobium sp. AntQ-1 TaxID=2930091 RepID=UPI00234F12A3|nr:hypothetical protein [Sphingobium sp. AntQ-1]WCP16213.1 hypothetical protein sphantq_04709 [Sphingobium sp. AntQ-1]
MKGIKIILGIGFVAVAAILSPPLMTRFWDERQLTLASSALLAHGLMGTLDFFKPIIIRRISLNPKFATINNLFIPSFLSSIIISLVFTSTGYFYLPDLYFPLVLSIGFCVIIYGIYSPFWGLLNANLRVSDTYLIRSLSVAFLYSALGVGALTGRDEVIYASLIMANLVPGFIFCYLSRSLLEKNGWSIDKTYWIEVFNVLIQNIGRSVIDFGDRLLAMLYLPVTGSGKYIIVSDIASRANFFTQLITIQSYPILCRYHEKAKIFLVAGICISASIICVSILFLFYGKEIYIWYLGDKIEDFFLVFCCLLSSFGVHTLGYFGQAILRSRSMDRSLSVSLLAPAFMCLIYLIVASEQLGLYKIIVLMVASKAGAFLMMARLIKIYPLHAICGMLCCVASWSFVAYALNYVTVDGGYAFL